MSYCRRLVSVDGKIVIVSPDRQISDELFRSRKICSPRLQIRRTSDDLFRDDFTVQTLCTSLSNFRGLIVHLQGYFLIKLYMFVQRILIKLPWSYSPSPGVFPYFAIYCMYVQRIPIKLCDRILYPQGYSLTTLYMYVQRIPIKLCGRILYPKGYSLASLFSKLASF